MSIPFSEVLEVKNHLKQQYINVSNDWIEACIEFIRGEHDGQTISMQNLKRFVYEQWLVADLEEISCSTLPQSLPTQEKITLNGFFALQVQGIRDISRPAYSQLTQLEGNTNSNAEFSSAPKASVPEWEAKPSRLLMLNLTDGCTFIQGMEYKPINFLSPNLPPGIKVLIQGPIDCRFGVLLLTSEKISILGGEVESKLHAFSREAILKEALQLSNDVANEDESLVSNSEERNSHGMQQAPSNSQLNVRTNSDFRANSTQLNHINTSNKRHIENLGNNQRNEAVNNIDNFEIDDDFEQGIDYDMLDEIENSQRREPSNPETNVDVFDIWQEDEDVVQELFEFEEANPEPQMPYEQLLSAEQKSYKKSRHQIDYHKSSPFTYLSLFNNPVSDSLITIKGFIVAVVSKLECTLKGWKVIVKINDGTSCLDAYIHDKVLENIIGISASDMVKMKMQSSGDLEKQKEVMEGISRCKFALQNCNCLMDIKFNPADKPCVTKLYSIDRLHIQQLFDRVCSSI